MKNIRDVFIRVARDSGFKMDAIQVAVFVGEMLGKSTVEVYLTFPSLELMQQVASGNLLHEEIDDENRC